MSGIDAIRLERHRQIEEKGWTAEHDDKHELGALAGAGSAYAMSASAGLATGRYAPIQNPPPFFGFSKEWWKPKTAREDLVRAGALIAAEIDALDRHNGRCMWAVGPEDDAGWQAIDAPTLIEAMYAWMVETHGEDAALPFPGWLVGQRVEAWDALEKITPVDWVDAGLSTRCAACEELTGLDWDPQAVTIDGTVYCEECAPRDLSAEAHEDAENDKG